MLKKLFSFTGRSSRKEYYILTTVIAALGFILVLAAKYITDNGIIEKLDPNHVYVRVFVVAVFLVCSFSSWCVSVRRAHDVGYSGFDLIWRMFMSERLLFKAGDEGPNIYGNPPDWPQDQNVQSGNPISDNYKFPEIWDGGANRK